MEKGLSFCCRFRGGVKCVLLSRFTVSITRKYIIYDKRKEMERQNLSA